MLHRIFWGLLCPLPPRRWRARGALEFTVSFSLYQVGVLKRVVNQYESHERTGSPDAEGEAPGWQREVD